MGQGSEIRDPGPGKKPIPDPGSRGQKGTGSRIRVRNTAAIILYVRAYLSTLMWHNRCGLKKGLAEALSAEK